MAKSDKPKMIYICSSCGYESSKWNGKCPSCGEWNTFEESEAPARASSQSKSGLRRESPAYSFADDEITGLDEIDPNDDIRYKTGVSELDRVLGGGIVKGSLMLLGGEPGIGKSTLLLQICGYLGAEREILYITGEESVRQIKMRAKRLGVETPNLYLFSTNDAEAANGAIISKKPGVAIIDSIQTMALSDVNSLSGSVTQVRECANLFMRTAKAEEIPVFIVGHVNKDGAIAGPKVMEHIVDAVLYFEGQRNLSYRILRAVKNRYGSTNEIGVFEMGNSGLVQVENPSEALLSGRPKGVSGSCIACIMEGSRPILAEVQALVAKSGFAAPRRAATGFDYNRMSIIIAVLEKREGMFFGSLDVFLNVVGGLRLDEPSGDLAAALALYSGFFDVPIDEKLAAFGEIGLGGEVRGASDIEKRIGEAARLGFDTCIVPEQSLKKIDVSGYPIKVFGVSSIRQAFNIIKKT